MWQTHSACDVINSDITVSIRKWPHPGGAHIEEVAMGLCDVLIWQNHLWVTVGVTAKFRLTD